VSACLMPTWQGGLVGKPVGIFTGTGSQNGGQETTPLTLIPWIAHQGMVFVPMGYVDRSPRHAQR
jgi:NAD(P)H dehydrogenase (quinone)